MDFKDKLGTLIDAVLAGKDDEAKAAFHEYSVARTSALVTEGEKGVNPFAKKDDKDDKKDGKKKSKKDDKSDDEDEDEDKGDKKKPKKGVNPFADKDGKKSKKDDDSDDEDDKKDGKKKGGFVPFKKKDKSDDE